MFMFIYYGYAKNICLHEGFDWGGCEWVDVGEKVIREGFQLFRDDGEKFQNRDR